MAGFVDSSQLSAELNESKEDFKKIFGIKVRDGFGRAKERLTPLKIDQKVGLKREFMTNLTQPGRTGEINNSTEFLSFKERIPELKPAKVDIFLDEIALYKLRTSFMNDVEGADVNDIYSLAGREHIINAVFKQIGKEVHSAIYNGQEGFGLVANTPSSLFQGGLNLFNGLGVKMLKGLATTGPGAVGDIPAANVAVNTAAAFNSTNALAELKKVLDVIYDTPHLHDLASSDDPADACELVISPQYFRAISEALDNLLHKPNQLVMEDGADFVFKALPRVRIVKETFMSGVENMTFSPKSNLFWLSPMVAEDVTSIKFQEEGRGLQIMIDWECNVDYADGRNIVRYKAV
jgi:hypothetical protein